MSQTNQQIKDTLIADSNNNYDLTNQYKCSCCDHQTNNFNKFKRHINGKSHKNVYSVSYDNTKVTEHTDKGYHCKCCNYYHKSYAKFLRHLKSKSHQSVLTLPVDFFVRK